MFIKILGKQIYYEVYGDRHSDALVYLHGGPGASCLDFVNQAKALGEKLKVIIFDQLGVLRSDAIAENEDYSMEYQVEMIEEMRGKLGIEKWSVLGHSYGGMLAVLYAATYPDSVNKVILECPSLWFSESAKSVAAYVSEHIDSLNNEEASELCKKMKSADDQAGRESLFDLSALLGYVTDMKLRNYLHGISFEEYQRSMNTEGITGEMWSKSERHLMKLLDDGSGVQGTQKRVIMTDNFLPYIQKIAAPLLLINGRYDPACTKYQTEFIMDNLPNAVRIVFENSGHFPRIEEADKYTRTVLEFMESDRAV